WISEINAILIDLPRATLVPFQRGTSSREPSRFVFMTVKTEQRRIDGEVAGMMQRGLAQGGSAIQVVVERRQRQMAMKFLDPLAALLPPTDAVVVIAQVAQGGQDFVFRAGAHKRRRRTDELR